MGKIEAGAFVELRGRPWLVEDAVKGDGDFESLKLVAPTDDPLALDAAEDDVIDPSAQEELDPEADAPDPAGAGGAVGDNETPDAPNTPRRFLPSSVGLTVLVDPDVTEIEANVA